MLEQSLHAEQHAGNTQGCVELLERSGVQISGKRAVVIGRSNIVGTPAALLLQQRDATVTVVHSRTRDAQAIVSEADIVIAAMGKPEFVRGSWIKPGAAVIDVGTNPVPVRAQSSLLHMQCIPSAHQYDVSASQDATKKRGYRLVGDVAFHEAAAHAAHITPVPGGVGPMTITMLLSNTVDSAKRALQAS